MRSRLVNSLWTQVTDALYARDLSATRSQVEFAGRRIKIFHRGTPGDLAAIVACFKLQQYEIPDEPNGPHRQAVDNYYARLVDAGQTPLILDAGAHIGAASVWFSERYPAARIVAVEPVPENAALVRRNTTGRAVEVIEAGLDFTPGDARLVDVGLGTDGYRMELDGEGPRTPMRSLAEVMDEPLAQNAVPFFMKVDIEGYEHRLFQADPALLGSFPVIAIESHDWLMPGGGTALPFFKFHYDARRDLRHGGENLFSLDFTHLTS